MTSEHDHHCIVMSGIGGQGILLATRLVGYAAALSGRQCLHFGKYGGEIRGTECECTLLMAADDRPVDELPVTARAHTAIAMHPAYARKVAARLMPQGTLVYNSSVIPAAPVEGVRALPVAADEEATRLGSRVGASLYAVAYVVTASGLLDPESLVAGLRELLPPYRHDTIPKNAEVIMAGAQAARRANGGTAPAHEEGAAAR